jgi:hypothetical protein
MVFPSVRAAGPGGNQRDDRVEVYPWALFGSVTTTAWLADALYLYHFRVAREFPFSKIALVTAATVAGTVDVAVMTNPSGDRRNFSRLVSSGPLTPAINSEAQLAMTAPDKAQPFVDYWLGFSTHDATLTILRVGTSAAAMLAGTKGIVKSTVWSSGIPSTVDMGASPTGVGAMPALALIA